MNSKINNGYPYLTWAFDFEEYWPNHIIASYDFSGNANDGSGNEHHGTEFGGVTLCEDRFGNANSAYAFDGIDDHIEIQNYPEEYFVSMQNSFSISVWFKFRGGVDDGQLNFVIDKGHAGGQHYGIAIAPDSTVWGGIPILSTDLLSDEKIFPFIWYHTVYSYDWDHQTGKLFLNNELIANTSFPNSELSTISNHLMKIGSQSKSDGSLDRYFKGDIDDIIHQ